MIRICVLGGIGAGKSFLAKSFGYPVFNADTEVSKIYKNNKLCFLKLKKVFSKHITSFPIQKREILNIILANKTNIKKINKVVHPIIQKKMKNFLKKYKNKKIVVLDIPLLLENKINTKDDILVFIYPDRKGAFKRLKKRKNFNLELFKKFRKIQHCTRAAAAGRVYS